MIVKTVGRSEQCSFIILDPPKKISRHHLDIIIEGDSVFVIDRSTNGTFLNGDRLKFGKRTAVLLTDKITLASTYTLDLMKILPNKQADPEATKVLNTKNNFIQDSNAIELDMGSKKVALDADKTQIGEILSMDHSSFVTIGRSDECEIKIPKTSVSKVHCKIRLIDSHLLELEDLGSTNGTYADGEKLRAHERYRFTSGVKITLGADTLIDLTKILPGIKIVQPLKKSPAPNPPNQGQQITDDEIRMFNDLEVVWREYQERQLKIASTGSGIMMGGMAASSLAAAMMTGPIAVIVGIGGSLMARYVSQQKASKLKGDFSYEDMFLQVYACPRCKESFQKRPWITIRDCQKCKIKFKK